jgi:UDP-GlcNAc:undecaprenyl-phosphate GlcNAc-1-phosphate transferase
MFLFGFLDDHYELSIIAKFIVQIICAGMLVLFDIRTHIVNIPEPLNIIITLIWVIGITNAFNHLDVMDGLAGSVAVIVSLAFFLSSGTDCYSAVLSLALLGSLLAFLSFNLPPAKIYMGNSGSHFLGFVLAAVALIISYAPLERRMALLSPILILGFPIFDTVLLIFTRVWKKKIPFKKSNDHLVLRFLALGYSKKKALLFMAGWALFFALCGLIVSRASNLWGIITVIFVILTSLVLGRRMWRATISD